MRSTKERGSNGIWLSEEFKGSLWAQAPRTCYSKAMPKLYRAQKMEGRRRRLIHSLGMGTPSERKPAGQLNLAPSASSGQDLAHIVGEITRRILEDGIPVTS